MCKRRIFLHKIGSLAYIEVHWAEETFDLDTYYCRNLKGQQFLSCTEKHPGEGAQRMNMLTQGLREGKEGEEEKHKDLTGIVVLNITFSPISQHP